MGAGEHRARAIDRFHGVDTTRGGFEDGERGEVLVHGLAAGTWPLDVRAHGYVPAQQDVEVRAGETTTVEVVLQPGAPFDVEVSLPDGHWSDQALLEVFAEDGTPVVTDRIEARGDAAVRAWRVFLPPGRHRLVGTAPSGATDELWLPGPDAGGAPLRLDLRGE